MQTLQFANATFPKESIHELGYGLGWFIKNYHGYYMLEHSVSIDGFIAEITLLPQEKIGIVVLCNDDAGVQGVKAITQSILDHLLKLHF